MQGMTLRQKVSQMFLATMFGSEFSAPMNDFLRQWQPGGFILLESNITTPIRTTELIDTMQDTVTSVGGIPLFVAVDQEGGTVARLREGFTELPVPMLLTATQDTDLAVQFGQLVGEELSAIGINMNLAPVADLHTNPDNPVIGRRSFGTSPEMVNPILAGYIDGLQSAGVIATVKHFPGHGATDSDSHVTLPILNDSTVDLAQLPLRPFIAAMEADVGAVMVAHIGFPSLGDSDNLPSSLSFNIVNRLLRQSLGYDGLVMSDAMDMDAIDLAYSPEAAAVRAVKVGHDLIIVGAHVNPFSQASAIQAVADAVENGEISEDRIDDSVRRILLTKRQYGILDWQPSNTDTLTPNILLDTHAELIDAVFTKGVTIAKDEQDLLPLSGEVLMIFPGSRPSIQTRCETYVTEQVVRWFAVTASPTIDEIASLARDTDSETTYVIFTQNADQDPMQVALVNGLPPSQTVVVALWSPYDYLEFPDISSYVLTYSPLEAGVHPACATMFGAIPARGMLPIDLGDGLLAGSQGVR